MESDYHMIMGLSHPDVTVVYQNVGCLWYLWGHYPGVNAVSSHSNSISDSVGVFLRQLQEEDRELTESCKSIHQV